MAPKTYLSVDLDDVGCYHSIYGLEAPVPAHGGVVLERCLPRCLDRLARWGARATFFVIGRDLQRDLDGDGTGAELLREAVAAGHELGNHSYAHAYDLTRWPDDAIAEDLRACDDLLRSVDAEPVGFRAPGYTHDRRLLRQVAALGYRYDASALPSPPYYLAKAAAIVGLRALGRQSGSLLRGGTSFFGSARPRLLRRVGLWELPISVTPGIRLPLIGTSLLAGPGAVVDRLTEAAATLDYFHLELHGIDFADPDSDPLAPSLSRRAPELRVPLRTRMARLQTILSARPPARPLRDALPDAQPDE